MLLFELLELFLECFDLTLDFVLALLLEVVVMLQLFELSLPVLDLLSLFVKFEHQHRTAATL